MMTLMQETVEQKKKNKNSMVTLVLSLAAVIAAFVLSNFFLFMDKEFSIWIFFDLGTFLVILLPTVIIMVAARQGKAFFRAFTMLGDSTRYTKEQRRESKAAVKLAANSMLVLGFMSCVATLPYLGGSYSQDGMEMEELIANATVALYGILYGLAAYLLLLPVCSRLEAVMEE